MTTVYLDRWTRKDGDMLKDPKGIFVNRHAAYLLHGKKIVARCRKWRWQNGTPGWQEHPAGMWLHYKDLTSAVEKAAKELGR